jgi:acetylornithine deacetylase/succinyl-diaminopimelate desuccinylase-like protein
LATERDAGANLIVTLLGPDPTLPFLACGSHLDSVPQGGNYNGAAGVVAGLLALARFRAEGFQPTRTVKLYAGFVPISVQPGYLLARFRLLLRPLDASKARCVGLIA